MSSGPTHEKRKKKKKQATKTTYTLHTHGYLWAPNILTYLSQISFGMIIPFFRSNVLSEFSSMITDKFFDKYLKTISNRVGSSSSRTPFSFSRTRPLIFLADFFSINSRIKNVPKPLNGHKYIANATLQLKQLICFESEVVVFVGYGLLYPQTHKLESIYVVFRV